MKKQKMVLVGLGLTDSHGHKRITRGDDFVLTGGNEETHAGMQERAIKFSERLKKKGNHSDFEVHSFIQSVRNNASGLLNRVTGS